MDMYFSAKTQTLAQFKEQAAFECNTQERLARHILRYGESNAPKQI